MEEVKAIECVVYKYICPNCVMEVIVEDETEVGDVVCCLHCNHDVKIGEID